MKINYKKITALATSALMVGMTMGVAAAANYPAPFVSGGAADVAIVYGTGSGVSQLDLVEAGNIQSSLQSFTTGKSSSTTTASGGDSVRIAKTSDEFNLRDNAAAVFVSSVDDDDLPVLLADGTYTDDDNTEYDYTQKVTLGGNLVLAHFSDTDYDDLIGASDDTPTIGIQLNTSSPHVLNYTFDLTTHPAYNAATLETTTMRLMGRDYYVLDVLNGTTNKTTFLDSANSAMITDGTTSTVAGRSISINFISSTETRLDVDGKVTNSLAEGATYKLPDGTYVGIKDILYDSKEAGISKVEISVGSGKLEIDHGAVVELNDESQEEITGFLVQDSSEKLDKIVLAWSVDEEEFISPDAKASLTMPAFGALKLFMGEHTFPAKEETEVKGGSSKIEIKTTLKDGAITIPILGANSTGEFATIGADSSNRLYTNDSAASLGKIFNETKGDKYMVLSWNSTTEAESYYLRADVVTEDTVTKVKFTNEGANPKTEKSAANGDTVSFGSADITINNVTRVSGLLENFNFSLNSGSSVNVLYTEEGMKIFLPYESNVSFTSNITGVINFTPTGNQYAGYNYDSYYLFFDTEDKDDNIGAGTAFNLTLDESGTTTNKVHVQTVTTNGPNFEIGSTDDFEYYVRADLATKIVHATGGDYDSATVTYPGSQSFGNLYLSAPEATVSSTGTGGTGALGNVLVKDSEASSVNAKNLVVVGGSCINSAAASLVGGKYCGAAWTQATGVGAGEFLIKGYASSGLTSKMALLVAGYEAADTVNAATYLRTQAVDTSKAYKGTSSTSAALLTSTA